MRFFIRRFKNAPWREVAPSVYEEMLDAMTAFPVEFEGAAVVAKQIKATVDDPIPF